MRSLLLAISQDLDESNENLDGVQVDTNGAGDWVVHFLRLGLVQDLLGVVEDNGTEEGEATVQVNVVKCWAAWVEHREDGNSKHGSKANGEWSSPVEELLTWGVVGHEAEGTDGETGSQHG